MNQGKKNINMQTIIILIVLGVFTGMLSGIVGVGGGIILVPALVYLLGFSQFSAQGTSLALIMFPVGILSVIQYHKNGYIDFKIVLMIAIGFILGSFWGSKIALQLPQEIIKKIFASLLLFISIKMLFFDNKKTKDMTKAPSSQSSISK